MSAAMHTPGPWTYTSWSGPDYGTAIYSVPGICTHIKNEADARLIAAAPEMLALLQRFERFSASTGFSYPLGSLQELQTVIAKATWSAS